jgi:hypothetical protein
MRWWKSSPSRTGRQIAARSHCAASRERCHNRIPLVNSFPSVVLLGEEGRSLNAPALHGSGTFRGCNWLALWNRSGSCRAGPNRPLLEH